jgi:3-oxoacyl-[acyl-carrier protein] reductase
MTGQNVNKKTALITGSGQGIGRAIAVRLAMEGAVVFVNDVVCAKAKNVVSEIIDKGGEAFVKCADVSKSSQVEHMISEIVENHGHIDILVNNARVEPPRPTTLSLEQWWDRVIDVSLKGSYLCSEACFEHMSKNKYGRIISISSTQAYGGKADKDWIAYSSAKSGLHGLSRSFARRGMQEGVTANIVTPDYIETEVVLERWGREKLNEIAASVPMGRGGKPEDVVKAVLFLIDSDFITGETIFVNGGRFVIQ